MAKQAQKLLVDTDAFCKLSAANSLADATALLGVSLGECGRLASLPYMLRRSRLRTQYGDSLSDIMMNDAERMPVALQASAEWLEPLVAVPSIDPGEALLLSATAEYGKMLITGDKRALQAAKDLPGYAEALNGRVVVLEAILIALCVQLGDDLMRARVRDLTRVDTSIRNCFSDTNSSPVIGLLSYFRDLASALSPLCLWRPPLT